MPRRIVVAAMLMLVAFPLQAAEPIPIAAAIVSHSRDRLAKLLRVHQTSIAVTPKSPFVSAVVRVDFYQAAAKVDSFELTAAHNVAQDSASITAQIADLGYLPLVAEDPEAIRLFIELETEGDGAQQDPLHASDTHDVPKAKCDLSQINSAGAFTDHVVSDGAIPLCWMLASPEEPPRAVAAKSLPDLLKEYPEASIIVVSIALR